jgi:hypothetical protein
MAGLNLFGIDESNRLYWDGQRIAMDVRLTRFQTFLAVIAAVGALLSGLSDALQYLGLNF